MNKIINKNEINNKNDIIFELYNKILLTFERLQYIMENCSKYMNLSSNLIKNLIKAKDTFLLDIIFIHLKFYDNEFILQLLLYYKNETVISSSDLNQQISIEKFKISINCSCGIDKYLINECNKDDIDDININIIKYLIEHGVDINKEDFDGETPLFGAYKKGNEIVVEYLVDHGADINKEIINFFFKGETPLFRACESGNEALVKYSVDELGVNINKENKDGETPLYRACESGNEALVKYSVDELGVNINKENKYGETPLFYACLNENDASVKVVKYLIEHWCRYKYRK